MDFRYVAYTNSEKKLVKGVVSGASAAAATQVLISQGYQPITLKPTAAIPPIEKLVPDLFKVKPKDIILFSRQLATLLESGISIVPALQLIYEEMGNRAFRPIITEILGDLRAGNPFSDALLKHRKIFGDLYCQLVAVGERTGGAAEALRQAASYMEKDAVIKKKIKKALTYPAIVMAVAVIVMGIMMVFVMPKMTQMFTTMDVPLPITTRLLIGTTDFVSGNILILLGVAALMAFAGFVVMRRPEGRRQLDQLLLRAPVIGKANLMGEMARFGRMLALLIHAGLPLPEILEMARRTSGNSVIKAALEDVRTGLVQGEGLSAPMSRNKVFPRLLVQMVVVGEESGRLESTLETVASTYEVEADDRISSMIAMIEPTMTLFLAGVVGVLALSVITPMYSITSAFK